MSVAYTWAKYLGNGGNINGGGNAAPQDARCFRCEFGNMPDGRAHVFVLNHDYELPFGPKRRFVNQGVMAHIIGDWAVTGIWSGDHWRLHHTDAGGSRQQFDGRRRRPSESYRQRQPACRQPVHRPLVRPDGVRNPGAIRVRQLGPQFHRRTGPVSTWISGSTAISRSVRSVTLPSAGRCSTR